MMKFKDFMLYATTFSDHLSSFNCTSQSSFIAGNFKILDRSNTNQKGGMVYKKLEGTIGDDTLSVPIDIIGDKVDMIERMWREKPEQSTGVPLFIAGVYNYKNATSKRDIKLSVRKE